MKPSGLDSQSSLIQSLAQPTTPSAAGPGSEAQLRKVAEQFEALFYNQLLQSMRSTVPENQFWGQSSGTKIYRQLHDQELAGQLAGQGGLGIADLIIEQFAGAVARETDAVDRSHELPVLHRRGLATYRRQADTSMVTVPGESTAAIGPRAAGNDLARLQRLASDLGGAPADTLARFGDDLLAAARETDLDPALLLAVTVRESGGDPAAVSPRGAQGLMQLMPGTAREVGVSDSFDPGQNLRGGARYLARMLARYDGDLDLALAAYNAGPGNVDAAGRAVPAFPETIRYIDRVKSLAGELGARTGTEMDKPTPGPDRSRTR